MSDEMINFTKHELDYMMKVISNDIKDGDGRRIPRDCYVKLSEARKDIRLIEELEKNGDHKQ